MTDQNVNGLWIDVSEAVICQATRLANARLTEDGRRLSPDRPSARNLDSQIRGAVGELVVAEWLRSHKFSPAEGFLDDEMHDSDLIIKGISIEVMTAKIDDRIKTGFCVPPNKLSAARRRGAWGYIFVGTNSDSPPRKVLLQSVAELVYVDSMPPRHTYVNNPHYSVLNYVVEPRNLKSPSELIDFLLRIASE